ncbi:MAG: sugar kinase [Proteobacteria bacterium]|nr:sugar kinase [Pseudomonadota bacterium]
MFAVVGTVPDHDFPLVAGEVTLENHMIRINGQQATVTRGTPALLAAAIKAGEVLDQAPPFAYLAGDIGLGEGSRDLYEYLSGHLDKSEFTSITFHYLMPDVDWHNRVLFAIEEMEPRPILIADAGFMYAAKMSGQASQYDLFTPDIGELSFLADEEAPHPFYTRGFILHEENRAEDLVTRAYEHENAAGYLLVKGKKDYLASEKGVQAIVQSHSEEAMEAIGGTGDTLTGIVTALIGSGMEISESVILAAQANRMAGHFAWPTPSTQAIDIINHIPKALTKILNIKGSK